MRGAQIFAARRTWRVDSQPMWLRSAAHAALNLSACSFLWLLPWLLFWPVGLPLAAVAHGRGERLVFVAHASALASAGAPHPPWWSTQRGTLTVRLCQPPARQWNQFQVCRIVFRAFMGSSVSERAVSLGRAWSTACGDG
jgi:hypothetical protein